MVGDTSSKNRRILVSPCWESSKQSEGLRVMEIGFPTKPKEQLVELNQAKAYAATLLTFL